MKKQIIIYFLLFYALNGFSQDYEILRDLSYKAVNIALSKNMNITIDSTNWEQWINANKENKSLYKQEFDQLVSTLKLEIETGQFKFKKTLEELDQCSNIFLNPNLNSYSDEFTVLIESILLNRSYLNSERSNKLFEISGYLELSKELKDSLETMSTMPLKVRAKLGNTKALDSLINMFNTEYFDTVNFDTPRLNLTKEILYVGSPKAYMLLSKILTSKHLVYIPLKNSSTNNCKRWEIVSINEIVLQELFVYYTLGIEKYIKEITYYPVANLSYKIYQLNGDEELYEKSKKKGVEIYATILSNYLSNKFSAKINIKYPGNIFRLTNRLEPPVSLIDDYDQIKCLVEQYYGANIFEESPEIYNRLVEEVKSSVKCFYKSLTD